MGTDAISPTPFRYRPAGTEPGLSQARPQRQVEPGADAFPPSPQFAADEAAPAAIAPGAEVGQNEVRVQMRLAGIIGQVLKGGAHHALGRHLLSTRTKPRRPPLDYGEGVADR